jgi:4-hydroxy-tetrahydrodipicolinate synthase
MMNRFGNRFKIFSASAHVPLFVSMIGGIGWMAAPANLIPRQCIRLYELCAAKQYEKALELQKKLWEINKIFSKNDIAACVKAGLKHLGFNMGDPLPPLNPLAEDQAGNLYQVIDSIRSL